MVHAHDFGLTLRLLLGTRVLNATHAYVLYEKPSGASGKIQAELGPDYIQVVIPQGFFDEQGYWSFQALVAGEGFELTGTPAQLYVSKRLWEEN